MKKIYADLWINALRSGKYKQGTGGLKDKSNGFCCLGVLCDIFHKGEWEDEHELNVFYTIKERSAVLPEDTRILVGMTSNDGRLSDTKSLASLNDSGKSFKEIADIIQKHWKKL